MSTNRPMRARDVLIESVTTLPTGADRYEGREVDYWPSGTAGSGPLWRLVWRGAANSGSGAWAVVGGGPLHSYVGALVTTSSFDAVILPDGPSVTIPAAGVYLARHGYQGFSGSAGGYGTQRLVGAGLSGHDASSAVVNSAAALQQATPSKESLVTLAAGTLSVECHVSGGTASFLRRYLTVMPTELRP